MVEEEHRITEEVLLKSIADVVDLPQDDVELLKQRIKITDWQVGEGSSKGDNFICAVKAATVTAEVDKTPSKTFNLIVKQIPMNPFREKIAADSGIFYKELKMYREMLPEWFKLLKGDLRLALPRCHFGTDQVIVMENLKSQHYKMVPRTAGLDLPHCRLLLEELALFHAVSHHYVQTYQGGLEQLRQDHEEYFHDDFFPPNDEKAKTQFDKVLYSMCCAAAAILEKTTPDLGKRTKKFLQKFSEHFLESGKAGGKFCILIHGDCWNNNFMFKYNDENKPTDIKILDLQCVRYARATLDLAYFLYTSITPSMRADHMKDLLKHYHTTLVSHLDTFGYSADTLTFDDLLKEFDQSLMFGFITGMFITQVVMSEKATAEGGALDMDKMTTDEEMERAMDVYTDKVLESEAGNTDMIERFTSLAMMAADNGII